ncbi:hypothetical protein SAMN04488123_109103 [Natribacillus halophilus]|uniref:Uncharacterized protein n=1 Tax=Natribacillus halophilus TaxID=549003 RepID=A0A1G8PTG5_9BACI|nr:hypothetical protein SAMN04488123_109103 [Natribacillus halophilus]
MTILIMFFKVRGGFVAAGKTGERLTRHAPRKKKP